MKKIILSLIILATIIAGYFGYQQFNNSEISTLPEQLDNVKIQNDGEYCTDTNDGSTCSTGTCFGLTCTQCYHSGGPCSSDGQCCDSECIIPEGAVTGTCDVNAIETNLEYIDTSLLAVAGTGALYNKYVAAGGTKTPTGENAQDFEEYKQSFYEENGHAYEDSDLSDYLAYKKTGKRVKNPGSNKTGAKGGEAGINKNNAGLDAHGPGENNLGANRVTKKTPLKQQYESLTDVPHLTGEYAPEQATEMYDDLDAAITNENYYSGELYETIEPILVDIAEAAAEGTVLV